MTQATTRSAYVTSYDVIKSMALLTMIVDHIGTYFFPEDLWWRAVGRLSAPFWLFLVGYARSRDVSLRMWAGLVILTASSFLFGGPLLPLSILLTIILIRLTIDYVGPYMISEQDRMFAVVVVFFFASLPTFVLSDYGSLGYLTALFGYVARLRHEGKKYKDEIFFGFIAFALYLGMTYITFEFTVLQFALVVAGCIIIYKHLYHFKPETYPALSEGPWRWSVPVLKFLGNRTLEIYVLHIVIFRACAAYNHTDGHGWLTWTWT